MRKSVNVRPFSERLERISHILSHMDSWPMLERCWRRQWAGLDSDERLALVESPFELHGLLPLRPVRMYAIWTVDNGHAGLLMLISVKTVP